MQSQLVLVLHKILHLFQQVAKQQLQEVIQLFQQ
jgi:hypothetical protein